MITAVRTGTVMCAIGIIASMGGYEQNMISLLGMFGRMAIFAALMFILIVADEVLTQRKRARRAGTRKAHKSNKYQVICHE